MRQLRATTQAAITEGAQANTERERQAVGRDRALQILVVGSIVTLLAVIGGSFVWRNRRAVALLEAKLRDLGPVAEDEAADEPLPVAMLPAAGETTGDVIEGEFEEVGPVPAPPDPTPRLVARPLPPVEESPWSAEEIERLIEGGV